MTQTATLKTRIADTHAQLQTLEQQQTHQQAALRAELGREQPDDTRCQTLQSELAATNEAITRAQERLELLQEQTPEAERQDAQARLAELATQATEAFEKVVKLVKTAEQAWRKLDTALDQLERSAEATAYRELVDEARYLSLAHGLELPADLQPLPPPQLDPCLLKRGNPNPYRPAAQPALVRDWYPVVTTTYGPQVGDLQRQREREEREARRRQARAEAEAEWERIRRENPVAAQYGRPF